MDTERASPRYSDIDAWAPLDIAEALIEGQFTAVAAVRAARFELFEAALAAAERLRGPHRLTQQHEIGGDDVVIAVAASGTTPFTVSCLNEAKRRGALTIGVANNRDTPILKGADHAIWLDTGAEPIAGSTRMKAGTAQRI